MSRAATGIPRALIRRLRSTSAPANTSYPRDPRLDGLIAFYAGVSPTGSLMNASIWQSTANAQQMDSLQEMIVDARNEFSAIGATFNPIVNYPIVWSI